MSGTTRWSSLDRRTDRAAGSMEYAFKSSRLSDGSIGAPSSVSPSSNPHAGFHPSSYSQPYPFSAVTLGASSSNASSSFGMSVSPPHWQQNAAPAWGPAGSFGGSLGALGTSFGRERDRELEARYVQDLACCGKQLNGMHELLEHFEEEHANLPPDVRLAAINAAQSGLPINNIRSRPLPSTVFNSTPSGSTIAMPQPLLHHSQHDDAPVPPGMMDIEMEDATAPSAVLRLQQRASGRPVGVNSAPASPIPWTPAFRPPSANPSTQQGVPPSLLSYHAPSTAGIAPFSDTISTSDSPLPHITTQRKPDKFPNRDEASMSDAEGEKRFPCPIEGCGKVYKQANGLKYHLTRSINSGHGNLAAIGGLAALLNEREESGG
ncbi:hypothetical protein BCR39DRAFT_538599 [Naematelia encephala]|uniref:C2H2-type domain-containing protein n=1 Tax=Naematelia encephala TaxID=71784 RepID=A0A1Y2AX52_9TREE|nr:hypothetical protein BCR39DRAFT_538599 [Naematelia encephala]